MLTKQNIDNIVHCHVGSVTILPWLKNVDSSCDIAQLPLIAFTYDNEGGQSLVTWTSQFAAEKNYPNKTALHSLMRKSK